MKLIKQLIDHFADVSKMIIKEIKEFFREEQEFEEWYQNMLKEGGIL